MATAWRQAAEARLSAQPRPRPPLSEPELRQLQHDLEIRQIELEIQDEERRRTESSLNRAQALAHVGNWSFEVRSGVVTWSPEMYRIHGVTPETFEHTFTGLGKLVHPDDWPKHLQAHEKCLHTGTVEPYECRVIRPDGEIRVVTVFTADVERDASGQIIRIFGAAQDVTERKRDELALRVSEENFRQLTESITDVFWIASPDLQQMQYVSSGYERIWGRPAESLYAHPHEWLEAVLPEDRERVARDFALLRATERVVNTEYRITRPDGAVRWILDRGFQVRDAAGQVVRVTGVARDITERKLFELKMHDARQRLKLATAASGVGIWEWHVASNQILWDDQMFRLYGVIPTTDGMVDYGVWSSRVLPEDLPRQEEVMQETFRRIGSSTREFRIRRADTGECRFLLAVETVRTDVSGKAEWMVGTNLDITERKQAENILRESEQKFARLFHSSPIAMVLTTLRDGRYLDVNEAFANLVQRPREQLIGHTSVEAGVWTADQRQTVMDLIRAQGEVHNLELEIRRKDNRACHILSAAEPVVIGEKRCLIVSMQDITERKEAEEKQARLAAIVESSLDGIISKSPDGIITTWNHGAETLFGFAAEEVVGTSILRLIPAERQAEEHQILERIRRGENVMHFDTVRQRKGGQLFDASVTASPVRDARGQIIGVSKVIRDITERKRTERALRTISACDQALVHATSEPELLREVCRVIIEQGGYRMTWVGFAEHDEAKSMRMAAVAGHDAGYLAEAKISWSETDAHGRGPTGIAMRTGRMTMCQDMRTDPHLAPWREAALEHGYRSSMTLPLLHAGKSFGVLTIYAAEAQAFQPAEVALLTALSEDLAYGIQALRMRLQHQQAEEQIRRLTVFSELNPNPVLEFGADGALTYHNQAALDLSQTLKLSGVPALLPPRVDELVRQCLATNQPRLREEIPHGPHVLSASFYPIRKINRVHCYMGDITERRQMESRMQQAQKMEAIGTLAGGIAHDFNNILGAMFGYGYLLQQDTVGNPLAQQNVAEILAAANRAKELVQQILSFSRQREQKPQIIKLDVIIKEVLKFLRASLPAHINIESELAAETPAVLADPTQIYQVTMNLATNALHAMEDKPGRLLVRLDPVRPEAELRRAHPELKPALYARLTVADTGQGMDAKTLGRIFEPFFTTKPVGKGTGLGLAVVNGIVEAHKGVITVESQVGWGTTFTFYFPAQAQTEPLPRTAAGVMPHGHGQKILVLDDETALTSVLQKMLGRLDYQVTTSNQAGEALRLVREHPAQFDLVITDLTMPEMNGLEVAQQIRAIRPDLPVILVSGYSVAVNAGQLRAAGICERLDKPVSPSILATALARVFKEI